MTLNSLRIETDGRIVPIAYFSHDNTLEIGLAGELYEFTAAGALAADEGVDESGGLVIAAMPGLVSLLRVKPGDLVAKGDAIAVTEAMKMEFTLRAPCAGKVATVNVSVGDQVEEGAIIATIMESHG